MNFGQEIHSTIFLSGCLIIIDKEKLNQNHIVKMSDIYKQYYENNVAEKLNEYIISNGLCINDKTDLINIDKVGFVLLSNNDIQILSLFNQAN